MNDASLYGRLFALLSNMYICKPTRESLANWRQLLRDEPLAEVEYLRRALDVVNLDSEQEIEDLLWEYTRLFIGPDRLPCPPLESVYTSPKRLVMEDAYYTAREFYGRIGIEIGSADVMPDHIGAELNFLSILFTGMTDKPEERSKYQMLADEFLAVHLRNWVPSFAEDMEQAAEISLYKELAKITRNAVAQCQTSQGKSTAGLDRLDERQ